MQVNHGVSAQMLNCKNWADLSVFLAIKTDKSDYFNLSIRVHICQHILAVLNKYMTKIGRSYRFIECSKETVLSLMSSMLAGV